MLHYKWQWQTERIFNIIDTKPLIIEKQNNKDIHLKNDTTYNVKFSDVTFAYESSNKNILSNINLNIKRGEKIALVGYSGFLGRQHY